MKIYKQSGSKDRLFEMFQNVNKIKLNEGIDTNEASILNSVFDQLKNKTLKVNNSKSQVNDNITYVVLICSDNENNVIKFTFKVSSQEGDQEDVYNIGNIILTEFSYRSADGSNSFDLDENDLNQFNQQHGQELYDSIDKYIDVESDSANVQDEELYEDAIKKIDSYPYGGGSERMQTGKAYVDQKPTNPKLRVNAPELEKIVEDSYGIPKPVNPSTKSPIEDLPEDKKSIILQAYNNLTVKRGRRDYAPSTREIQDEIRKIQHPDESLYESDYPDSIGKEFDPVSKYPKEKKKQNKKVKLSEDDTNDLANQEINRFRQAISPNKVQPTNDEPNEDVPEAKKQIILQAYDNLINRSGRSDYMPTLPEIEAEIEKISGKPVVKKNRTYPAFAEPYLEESTDQDKYEDVVFMQGDEAYQPLEILDREGKDAALEYLKQWHYPGEHQGSDKLGHGTNDYTYEKDGYVMSWNPSLEYIGLQYDLSKMNEDVPHASGAYIQDGMAGDLDRNGHPIPAIDPDFRKMGMGIGTSMDGSNTKNIEQLAKEKEETGDMLQGGVGDDKSVLEFDPDQILKGLAVEMEHTDNPMIAIEIAMDHLTENPEYYGVSGDENPEVMAQANAAADVNDDENSQEDDDELTDKLLGYQPKNVGDEVDEDIVGSTGAVSAVGNNSNTNQSISDDSMKKYDEYKKKDFNTLPDDQKEEYFELWKKFNGK